MTGFKRNKKSLYSLELKAKFICWFEQNKKQMMKDNPHLTTFSHCQRKFGICRKMLSDWVKNKEKIFATNYKRTRNRVFNEKTNESSLYVMQWS